MYIYHALINALIAHMLHTVRLTGSILVESCTGRRNAPSVASLIMAEFGGEMPESQARRVCLSARWTGHEKTYPDFMHGVKLACNLTRACNCMWFEMDVEDASFDNVYYFAIWMKRVKAVYDAFQVSVLSCWWMFHVMKSFCFCVLVNVLCAFKVFLFCVCKLWRWIFYVL